MSAAAHVETLTLVTPEWAKPLFKPAMYKGAKGGRSSGKSHLFAEMLVENILADANYQMVCIREIQRSLKYSAKKLVESKIEATGYGKLFKITENEIRRVDGDGVIIFQGMQDHTAASIKSLEGFDGAWFEEAQNASALSIELLIPTIRKDGSEIWFSWNPDRKDDAIEQLFADAEKDPDFVLVKTNYTDNPWCPDKSIKQAEAQKKKDYERFAHIWLGGLNTKSKAQIFADHWRVDEFKPEPEWDGPYHGIDFGFANDPFCAVKAWINENTLYVEYDSYDEDEQDIGLELDDTADWLAEKIPNIAKYTIIADNARPECISYLSRHGLPKIESCDKWKGSIEDGISFLKSFDEIVIHTRCEAMQEEAQSYNYKVEKRSGEILPDVEDKNNHRWDALRYALGKIIKQIEPKKVGVFLKKSHR